MLCKSSGNKSYDFFEWSVLGSGTNSCLCIRDCDLSKKMKEMTTQLRKCTNAFSLCRQTEDAVIGVTAACSRTAAEWREEAEQLSANKQFLESVQTVLTNLSSSLSRSRNRNSNCSSLVAKTQALLSLVNNDQSSSEVEAKALEITTATQCQPDSSLSDLLPLIADAIQTISSTLDTVQNNINRKDMILFHIISKDSSEIL